MSGAHKTTSGLRIGIERTYAPKAVKMTSSRAMARGILRGAAIGGRFAL
jgi:hypothetical protein